MVQPGSWPHPWILPASSFNQVHVIPEHLIYKPDLYELQTITLSAIYLQVLSATAISWNQIGFGLRRAQDVGAHRRRSDPHPTAENEQWKRVFWYFSISRFECGLTLFSRVLLCLEWQCSNDAGRPVAMHDQEWAAFASIYSWSETSLASIKIFPWIVTTSIGIFHGRSVSNNPTTNLPWYLRVSIFT